MAATPAAYDVLVLANKPRGVDPFTIGIIAWRPWRQSLFTC